MKIILVATWAFCILIGALMITPEGIVWINVNPAVTKILGVIGVVLGISGLAMNWKSLFRGRTN